MCFLCGRALDGWEDGDDPVTEHLKHSPDCGWAIMMDIQSKTSNPAEIEDPTSSSIVEARRATFAVGWPHEGKRGWLCQSEKVGLNYVVNEFRLSGVTDGVFLDGGSGMVFLPQRRVSRLGKLSLLQAIIGWLGRVG